MSRERGGEMKLKTLEDIMKEKNWKKYCNTEILREEAIKWFKERNLNNHQNCDAKICWLKFFNISMKDLAEETKEGFFIPK